MKLNLGCGAVTPEGWVNVDYAVGASMAKLPFFGVINRRLGIINLDWNRDIVVHDLRTRFPWDDESVDIIYTSHTLEHLSREEGIFFLSECRRVIRPQGLIRIVVPDLAHIISGYTDGSVSADMLLEKMEVYTGNRDKSIKGRLKLFIQSPHKCMYDTRSMIRVLAGAGFDVQPRKAFDSDIEDIERIELEGRAVNAVIVEGKPARNRKT